MRKELEFERKRTQRIAVATPDEDILVRGGGDAKSLMPALQTLKTIGELVEEARKGSR